MKALVIDCSPEHARNVSGVILNPFIDGLSAEGAEVEVIRTSELRILPCRGCTSESTFQSPGKCLNSDDMNELYPKLTASDLWVFASYLNGNGSGESVMRFLDRLEPLFQPYDFTNGNTETDMVNPGKIALITTGENWEKDQVNEFIDQFRSLSTLFDKEFSGFLLRPNTGAINALEYFGIGLSDIYDAARKAGAALVRDGAIPEELTEKVGREIVPKDSFVRELNSLIEKVK